MKTIICMIGVLACLGFFGQAKANIITFELDTEFSGATQPAGTDLPWLEAKFDDQNTIGSVSLKLEAKLTGTEKITEVYLNFDDLNDVTLLSFSTSDPIDSIQTGMNAFKTYGDGWYDILIGFPNSGTDLFDNYDEYYITITLAGITANNFDFLSSPGGGNGIWGAAADVQGIGDTGGDSGWIGLSEGFTPIPEPGTMLLLGTGLVGVAGAARRRKKNQA